MKENSTGIRDSRTKLMAEGPIKKTLLTLAIPTIIATIINAVYNFVDTLFVGMLNDTAAMGAVSVAFPLFMIISALGQMLGVGSASFVARSLGGDRKDKADKTASTALFLAVIIAAIATTIVLLFLEPILNLMGATEGIIMAAKEYSTWLISGSIFTIVNMTLNNIVRAEGNARYSMNALIIGAVLNIIFDPIFMFVFGLGLKGAAIATVLGQAVSTVYLLRYYIGKKSYVKVSRQNISKEKEIYSEIFKIGLPVFLMQFLSSMAFSIQNVAASAYGDNALAAIGITLKITIIPLYVMMGYNQGFQPFAAFNYGAGNLSRVKEGLNISIKWLVSFGFLSAIIFTQFPEPFVKLFTSDAEVIKYAVNNMITFNIFMPLIGYIMINTGLFQSFGKGKQAATLSIVRQGLFLIPALIILPKAFAKYGDNLSFFMNILPNEMPSGLAGVMYAQPVADILAFILTGIFAYFLKKEIQTKESENNGKIGDLKCQR